MVALGSQKGAAGLDWHGRGCAAGAAGRGNEVVWSWREVVLQVY